jgi:hypothetical protein
MVAALMLVGAAIAFAAEAGATEVGVNVPSMTQFSAPKALAAIRESRPAWVRVFLPWDDVEPTQGSYLPGWISTYQHFFDAVPKGTKIDVDVVGTPAWANGGAGTAAPPSDPNTFAQYVNHLVTAFHGRVNAWEIWNEESSPNWWSGSVAQFAALMKAAYPAIKSADPKAVVIMGANSPEMLAALYGDGIKGYFDGDAVHTDTACNITSPYIYEYNRDTTTVNQYFFLGFTGIHAIMAAHGDGSKPIYMTEIGWSSTDAECQTGEWAGQKVAGVSEATQAQYLMQAYHCLAQPKYSYVKAAMWFELANGGNDSAAEDNYGLLNANLTPKPAFPAFEQVSTHRDTASGSCGNFAGPRIRILHPTPGKRFSGPLRIAVAASSPANGVREITIELTGHSREHFGPKKGKRFPTTLRASLTWNGASRLRAGPHRIKVIVIDKLGNVSTRTFDVVHMPGRRAPRHQAHH